MLNLWMFVETTLFDSTLASSKSCIHTFTGATFFCFNFYKQTKFNPCNILKSRFNCINSLIWWIEVGWFCWICCYGSRLQCRSSMTHSWLALGNSWMSFGQVMILGKCMAKVLMWVISTGRRSTDANHNFLWSSFISSLMLTAMYWTIPICWQIYYFC